jgi:hypothetical protein
MDNKYEKLYREKAEELIKRNWPFIEPYCNAIYLGGSRVDPVIDNPHDFDFAIYPKDLPRAEIIKAVGSYFGTPFVYSDDKELPGVSEEDPLIFDFSQIKLYPYDRIVEYSYLEPLSQLIVGEDVKCEVDVIGKHREAFKASLFRLMRSLLDGSWPYPKRWYHILRGVYILKNNSYEVTEEQKKEINILHDLADG